MPIKVGTNQQYQEQQGFQPPNPRQMPMVQAPQGAPLPNMTPDTRPEQVMMASGLNSIQNAVQAVAEARQRDEDTSFLADMSSIQRAAIDWQANYKQSKQGQDALTAGQDFETMMGETVKPYQEKWKDNPRIATALERKKQELSLTAFGAGSNYAAQQRETWNKETVDGAVAGWKSALAGGNDASVHQAWELLDATLATTMPGHDTDAIKQQLLQQGAEITLDRRLAMKDYSGFQNDLQNFSGSSAPSSAKGVKGFDSNQPYRFGDIVGSVESGSNYGAVTPLDVNAASYGKYQFHAGASLTDFLKQSSFGNELQAAGKPGSAGFNVKWQQLADNPQFQNEQDAFAKDYFLNRPLEKYGATWLLDRSSAVQEAVMHTFGAAEVVGKKFLKDIDASGGDSLSDEQILGVIENRYKNNIRDDWPTAIGKSERGEPGGVSQQALQKTKLDEMAQFRSLLSQQSGGLLPGKQTMWQNRLEASVHSDIVDQANVGNIDRARELLAQNGQYLTDDQQLTLSSKITEADQQKARREKAARVDQQDQVYFALHTEYKQDPKKFASQYTPDTISSLIDSGGIRPAQGNALIDAMIGADRQSDPVVRDEAYRLAATGGLTKDWIAQHDKDLNGQDLFTITGRQQSQTEKSIDGRTMSMFVDDMFKGSLRYDRFDPESMQSLHTAQIAATDYALKRLQEGAHLDQVKAETRLKFDPEIGDNAALPQKSRYVTAVPKSADDLKPFFDRLFQSDAKTIDKQTWRKEFQALLGFKDIAEKRTQLLNQLQQTKGANQ
jgi:hypothetical protein